MSSAGVDTDVNIRINAEDNASSVVNSTTLNLENRFKAHRAQLKMVRMEYELNHKGLLTTLRAMQSVGMLVNRAISLYNSYTLTQIRTRDAVRRVAESERDLAMIRAEFGENSPQFRRAEEERIKALEDEKRATDEARIGYVLMVASLVADSSRIITTVIPRFRSLLNILRAIKTTGSIPSTTPIGTPTTSPSVSGKGGGGGSAWKNAGKGALGTALLFGAGELYQLGIEQERKNNPTSPTYNYMQQQKQKQLEDIQNGASYVLNLIVNSTNEAKREVMNFFNTYG